MDLASLVNQKLSSISELMNPQVMENGTARGDWDANAILDNLSFLEDKIHRLKTTVHQIASNQSQAQGNPNELLSQQQQQLVLADLTSIIIQLISHAGTLLPSPSKAIEDPANPNSDEDCEETEGASYEILQLEEEEILAPHTHFCGICGKGFKRDANLRMHMRGHGDEYKTMAALAKPKESICEGVTKRYSCPFAGCKRNREHKKFQPLKTILCVKNHYKRSHCEKSFTCSICNAKKFSVIADLKTHEKHCGKEKWLCSCGTSFSRKDKLFGHVALFHGHTPAIPDHPLPLDFSASPFHMETKSYSHPFSPLNLSDFLMPEL